MDMAAYLPALLAYRYWILFPVACVEGPFIAFIAGMLVAGGYMDAASAFTILLIGDVIPDTAFMLLGRYGSSSPLLRRLMARLGATEDKVAEIARIWREHPGKTMLLTKFAFGLSAAFLIMAGYTRMRMTRFFSFTIPIGAATIAALMGLGFFFGQYIRLIEDALSAIGIASAVILGAGLVYHFFGTGIRDRLMRP